jgi:putative hydrolase of the HAD superfamily
MFKAIIFDLDDTLIDFRERKKVLIEASVKAMIKAGLKEKFNVLHREFTAFYWENGIEDQNIFEKFFMHKYGKVDYRILAHAVIAYRRANSVLLKPYPDVIKVLRLLKKRGIKLAVLSDAPRVNAHIRLVEVGLDGLFDTIVTFDDVGACKPNSLGFKMVLSRLNVKASSCLMVGDNPLRDVVGARNAGIKMCLAAYSCSENIKTEYRINSIKELLKVVSK